MGWIRDVVRALAASGEARVQPRGAWINDHFDSTSHLTIAPVDPAEVQRRDLVFIRWKSNHVIRLVLDTRPGEVLVGKQRYDDGDWIVAESVLGRVTQIEKEYELRDPINTQICYDVVSADAPPCTAWGDYQRGTFYFYARHNYWKFVYSSDPEFRAGDFGLFVGTDLDAIQQGDDPYPEEFVAAFKRCFVRSQQYGEEGAEAASYMPQEEVLRIVRECFAEYERGTGS